MTGRRERTLAQHAQRPAPPPERVYSEPVTFVESAYPIVTRKKRQAQPRAPRIPAVVQVAPTPRPRAPEPRPPAQRLPSTRVYVRRPPECPNTPPTYPLPTSRHGSLRYYYHKREGVWVVLVYAHGDASTRRRLVTPTRTADQTIEQALAWLEFNATWCFVHVPRDREAQRADRRAAQRARWHAKRACLPGYIAPIPGADRKGRMYPLVALPEVPHGTIRYVYDKALRRWNLSVRTPSGVRCRFAFVARRRTAEQSIALAIAWLEAAAAAQQEQPQ